MTIAAVANILCPTCQRSYDVTAKRAGRTIKCWCGGSITFPSPGGDNERAYIDGGTAAELDGESDGTTAGSWWFHVLTATLWAMLLSIPLSFLGIAVHPKIRPRRPQTTSAKWKGLAVFFIPLGTFLLALAISASSGCTFDSLNHQELTLSLGVIIGGTILALIVTSFRPVLGVLCPFVVAIAAYMTCQHIHDGRQGLIASLRTHFDEYTHISPIIAGHEGISKVTLRGKMIVINRDTKEIDNLYFLLPGEVQAREPRDVRTIVWIQRTEEVAGTYRGQSGRPLRRIADVTFIDNSNPATVVYRKRFAGGDPPAYGKDIDLYGPPPDKDILEFIQARSKLLASGS